MSAARTPPCVVVAVYGNRAYDDCLVEMEDLMTEKGLCRHRRQQLHRRAFADQRDRHRPPDESDLAKSKAFGKQLAEKLQKGVSPLPKGTIPGNRPLQASAALPTQWARKMSTAAPTVGLCVRNCPVGAIDAEDPGKVDASKCLRCLACVRLCPIHSKQFTSDAYQRFGRVVPLHLQGAPQGTGIFICKPSKKIPRDITRDFLSCPNHLQLHLSGGWVGSPPCLHKRLPAGKKRQARSFCR